VECNHELETQLVHVIAYLRSELGYQTETPGNLRRQVEEHEQMIAAMDKTLRGSGDELGVIGWMMVLRRSWITIVALMSTALGYFLNDVVHSLGAGREVRGAAVINERQ
jgi:hypothetical protein